MDASAALLKDGEIVAAAEEERFTRLKFMGMRQTLSGIPDRAIQYCLDKAGITLDEVDHICYFFRPFVEMSYQMAQDVMFRGLKHPPLALFYMFQKVELFKAHMKSIRRLTLSQKKPARVHYVEHHRTHAATCHFLSGVEESAVLIVDAVGEHASTTWYHARGSEMTKLRSFDWPDSLGMLYAQITRYCGFEPWADEYKVMGLAAFGKPRYLDKFRQVLESTKGGGYRVNRRYLNSLLRGPDLLGPRFYETFGPARTDDEALGDHHRDMASSLQARLEEVALEMAEEIHRRTGSESLCVSGGVALNCSMIGRLQRDSPFERIITHNSAGDAGTSLGAALYTWHSILGNPVKKAIPNHAYLGPSYDNERILKALKAAKCTTFERYDEAALIDVAAQAIARGEIVAWFQGGMEWGPRALGARSILANPAEPGMKDKLNAWVKHREEFRPFAPSVMEEHAAEYFECDGPSPYMTVVYRVRPDKKEVIPAVTHVDGTARVQTVSERDHPRYYRLIKKFYEITGVPLIVNTSFNVMGEPVVCTPEDAIRCFYGTGIDRLVIGDFVVNKIQC